MKAFDGTPSTADLTDFTPDSIYLWFCIVKQYQDDFLNVLLVATKEPSLMRVDNCIMDSDELGNVITQWIQLILLDH